MTTKQNIYDVNILLNKYVLCPTYKNLFIKNNNEN